MRASQARKEVSVDPSASLSSQASRSGHRGPSLLVVSIVFTALFVASLTVSTAMAGGEHFPSPFQPEAVSAAYFSLHAEAVRAGAFFQFGSAIPLGIFTATAVSRLRFLGVNVAGGFIALFGGFAASLFLASSALVQWVLSYVGAGSSDATHAFHLLAFATGGVGYVAPAGLLVAGISVSGGLSKLLPKWLMWFGLAIAALAELSTFSLIITPAMYLLPAARFPSFVRMICVGALLPKARLEPKAEP
jgi:hypothetical protein